MKDHEISELVTTLANIAKEFGTHQSIRQRLHNVLVPIINSTIYQERENCAQICEDTDQEYEAYTGRELNRSYSCAANIRKLNEY